MRLYFSLKPKFQRSTMILTLGINIQWVTYIYYVAVCNDEAAIWVIKCHWQVLIQYMTILFRGLLFGPPFIVGILSPFWHGTYPLNFCSTCVSVFCLGFGETVFWCIFVLSTSHFCRFFSFLDHFVGTSTCRLVWWIMPPPIILHICRFLPAFAFFTSAGSSDHNTWRENGWRNNSRVRHIAGIRFRTAHHCQHSVSICFTVSPFTLAMNFLLSHWWQLFS